MATSPNSPTELRKRSPASKMVQAAVIVVLLAVVAGCDYYAAKILRRLAASKQWPGVPGVLRDFRVHRSGWNPQEGKYVVDCGYRYTINGATFAATNRLAEEFSTSFDADKWVRTWRGKGGHLTVFCDPQDPARCGLSRTLPGGVMPGAWLLGIVSVGAAGWFGRRLLRLAAGKEDFTALVVRPPALPGAIAPGSEGAAAGVANLSQKLLRGFFAALGAMSCWWMAFSLYRDWSLPANQRTLPSADLIFVMEFILAHSGAMVSGMLKDANESSKAKVEGILILAGVYLVFAVSIAAAGHSARLFVSFSGILISRWAGLFLDSNKAREQQFLRSMETFLVLFFSVILCLVCLRQSMEVTLIVYFGLIGIFELTLPLRKRSFLPLPTVGGI